MYCRRQAGESATQFWWTKAQRGSATPQQPALLQKQALFPVHVVNYSGEQLQEHPSAMDLMQTHGDPARAREHAAGNKGSIACFTLNIIKLHKPCQTLRFHGVTFCTPVGAIQALQRLAASNPKLYKALLGMKKDSNGRISTATLSQVCNQLCETLATRGNNIN